MPESKYNKDGHIAPIIDNLLRLDVRIAEMNEVRGAHIKELAYELYNAYADGESLNMLDGIREACGPYLSDIADTVRLACELTLLMQQKGNTVPRFFAENTESVPAAASDKVACVGNYYTDSAYTRFAAYLQKPQAVYLDSFTSACEDVASQRYEYAILPIENSDDGKLMGFYRLLDMHGLKIAMTSSISASDDSKSTTLALVKRGIEAPGKKRRDAGHRYFEFSLVCGEKVRFSDICLAAELFGMRVHKAGYAALAYSENEFEHYIVIDTEEKNLFPFVIFLELIGAHYTPIGYYTHIK